MSLVRSNPSRSSFAEASSGAARAASRRRFRRDLEVLEGRQLLSTLGGTTDHHDAGSGPMPQATVEPAARADRPAVGATAFTRALGTAGESSGVTYYYTRHIHVPVTAWQGLRGGFERGQYLISGTSLTRGLLFVGSISGKGKSYFVNYPGAARPASTGRTTSATATSSLSAATGAGIR